MNKKWCALLLGIPFGFLCLYGDLVYNWMAGYDDYMDISATAPYPMCHVIGNHDYDQGTLFETEQGNMYYESYVGPTHYSFDLGDIHYLVFNDIMYDRKSPTGKYYYDLDVKEVSTSVEDGLRRFFEENGTSPIPFLQSSNSSPQ